MFLLFYHPFCHGWTCIFHEKTKQPSTLKIRWCQQDRPSFLGLQKAFVPGRVPVVKAARHPTDWCLGDLWKPLVSLKNGYSTLASEGWYVSRGVGWTVIHESFFLPWKSASHHVFDKKIWWTSFWYDKPFKNGVSLINQHLTNHRVASFLYKMFGGLFMFVLSDYFDVFCRGYTSRVYIIDVKLPGCRRKHQNSSILLPFTFPLTIGWGGYTQYIL